MRLRMAVWFGVSFVAVMLAFVAITFQELEEELHNKNWRTNYPDHPDWRIHGSYSTAEVKDIMKELTEMALLCGVPLALLTFLLGWWMARKSLQPIARINDRLQTITHKNLTQQISTAELDREFQPLANNINDLLTRLHGSFSEMSEYAAKVAHELRSPLAILRLKVENAGNRIAPELADELHAELHRLGRVVDQALLIAKAEQGRLVLQRQAVDAAALVNEVAEDYRLLAEEEGRTVQVRARAISPIQADPKYLRQIIHSLLTNALKHGERGVHVWVAEGGGRVRVGVANAMRTVAVSQDQTLGLGLRVVRSLLLLHVEARYRVRQGPKYYAAQFDFPACPQPEAALFPQRRW
jgi:signal transduction histidine kinase